MKWLLYIYIFCFWLCQQFKIMTMIKKKQALCCISVDEW